MTIQRMIELLAYERKCVESADKCDRNCGECNLVQDADELLKMYDGVIGLLKVQEPCLLTLEEVKSLTGKDLYLELYTYPGSATYLTAVTLSGVGSKGVSFYHTVCDFEAYNKYPYGWRCWTSRPTIEKMNNIPWEERDNGEKAE